VSPLYLRTEAPWNGTDNRKNNSVKHKAHGLAGGAAAARHITKTILRRGQSPCAALYSIL
jgi:hypothetical protein